MKNSYIQLFHDAADGLTEYFSFLMYSEFRQIIGSKIYPSFNETGDNQTDYELLRDLIEAEANKIQTKIQDYVVIENYNISTNSNGYCYGKDTENEQMLWSSEYPTSSAAWLAAYQDTKGI